jgi:hypothetical protein
MPVLKDLACTVTLEDVWRAENGGRPPRPMLQRLGEEVYPEALKLFAPSAVFDQFSVQKVTHDRITLDNGEVLRGPDVARLLAPAKQVFVAAASIGPALEARASHYFSAGEKARGYLLDCLGTATMDSLVKQVCAHFENAAAPSGYPLGFPISPGDSGWPIAEQRVLFRMLPTDLIGVSLTDTCVMLPKKSLSFVVGVGPGIQTAAEASQCDYCSVQDRCRHRQRHGQSACPPPDRKPIATFPQSKIQ